MDYVSAVIGASYGDEGKGHLVDYLSNKHTLVVRYNGGAQAGHTVQTPDGRRHVFHHVGAGTFAGAHTFLSRFFISNPIIFAEEHRKLSLLEVAPKVSADPASRVTTPWDMIVNQVFERARGDGRHGSCGLGIHETTARHAHGPPLYVTDLLDPGTIQHKLEEVRYYSRSRLIAANLEVPSIFDAERMMEHFLEDIGFFNMQVDVEPWRPRLLDDYRRLVFEGAQGLRLDENGKDFPHVTCSKTGLPNVAELAREAGVTSSLSVVYVTRPYLTRHGAGPLNFELNVPPYLNVVDRTNLRNEFQGDLRFAWLDLNEIADTILRDVATTLTTGPTPKVGLAVTCIDHIDDNRVTWVEDGKIAQGPTSAFLRALEEFTRLKVSLTGHGPTHLDIRVVP